MTPPAEVSTIPFRSSTSSYWICNTTGWFSMILRIISCEYWAVLCLRTICAPLSIAGFKNLSENGFSRSSSSSRDFAPRVGNENNVLQCRVTTEFVEHVEIPSCHSGEPFARDPVDVNHPGKLEPILVAIKKLSLEDQETTRDDVYSRSRQKSCDCFQNPRITL